MTRIEKIAAACIVVAALGVGWMIETKLSGSDLDGSAELLEAGIVLLQQGRPMPRLSMTNQDGQAVIMNELKGGWSLLFFGYTFCPDICPTTLAQLREIQRKLAPADAKRLQVYFVSVDPHRDTAAQLKSYLGYFDKAFKGLTAPEAVLLEFSTATGIPYLPPDTSQPNYTVQHSGNLALVGPDGQLRGFIRAPFDTAMLLRRLPGLLERD
ncbi:SCO family protein [Pseudomonas sp. RIT-PI-S]|uniref:SCO family protein n=1 Tax=Pseudomonas sp. RIT-PI-S TaxID=3035295 RepID=UPI0021D9C0AB|nr:SCO family protein [Pseudomonas sp. RIT-PI-S]